MKVTKAFNSTTQRFKPGDDVDETTNLEPHSLESLQAAGYIAGGASTSAPPAPPPSAAAAAAAAALAEDEPRA